MVSALLARLGPPARPLCRPRVLRHGRPPQGLLLPPRLRKPPQLPPWRFAWGARVWASRLLRQGHVVPAPPPQVSPHLRTATVDKLAAVELLPAWSGGVVGQHPPLINGTAVMALSSSPDSDGFQQLSVQGSPSPVDLSVEAPRKLAVLGLPWDTRLVLCCGGKRGGNRVAGRRGCWCA